MLNKRSSWEIVPRLSSSRPPKVSSVASALKSSPRKVMENVQLTVAGAKLGWLGPGLASCYWFY